MARRAPAVLTIIAALLSLVLVSSVTADSHTAADYARLLAIYQSGNTAAAVDELQRWTHADVDRALATARTSFTPDQSLAAAMFHTDLANVLVSHQVSDTDFHIAKAGDLIDAATPRSPRAHSFSRRWHYFVISMYTSVRLRNQAQFQARAAQVAFPDDGLIAVAFGLMDEARAEVAGAIFRARPNTRLRAQTENLTQAAVNGYLKALALDSHLAVAHLHIGWLRIVMHDVNRARPELKAAIDDAQDDRTRYLAHLFLGAAETDDHQLRRAVEEYEAALDLGRSYQSGYVALSRAEEALGHHDRARQLALLCTQIKKEEDDPWLDYLVQFDRQAWIDLRAEALRR